MLATVAQVQISVMVGLAHVNVERVVPTSIVTEILFASSANAGTTYPTFDIVAVHTSRTSGSLLATISLAFPHDSSFTLSTSSIPIAGACNLV